MTLHHENGRWVLRGARGCRISHGLRLCDAWIDAQPEPCRRCGGDGEGCYYCEGTGCDDAH